MGSHLSSPRKLWLRTGYSDMGSNSPYLAPRKNRATMVCRVISIRQAPVVFDICKEFRQGFSELADPSRIRSEPGSGVEFGAGAVFRNGRIRIEIAPTAKPPEQICVPDRNTSVAAGITRR